ncbi:MAG TPA: hypothetical protein VLL27_00715 [Solirubrobacterales bacterium]|nr:hypothetical protein [Solirubrobacterales bacterium]
MPGPTELQRKVVAVHRCLTEAGLPHAIGGAVALGVYAEPRPTVDIDVNVFVAAEREPAVREALAAVEPDGAHPIHLFFSDDDLHEAMRDAVREAPFGGETIPLVAPEHLVVRKALIGREKDWADIAAILAAVDPLDTDEVERWLQRLGAENVRVKWLHRSMSG